MKFTYSICHPEIENIEYKNTPISGKDVLSIAKTYGWIEKLELSETMDQNKVYYSPSLDFECINNKLSLGLTADFNDKRELSFSLWFKRPKKVKIFFGLFGEKEKFVVDDVWNISFENAIKYLEHFVNGNYQIVENLYNNKK